jgi:dTDP-4-amino-4,6-dideoxygalactose transaminase
MYYILVKNNKRDKLIKYLQQKKINAVFHYIPLHSSPFGRLKATTKSTMRSTNRISNTLLRLPMHLELDIDTIYRIYKNILSFYNKI